jgi:hypothetical protein
MSKRSPNAKDLAFSKKESVLKNSGYAKQNNKRKNAKINKKKTI